MFLLRFLLAPTRLRFQGRFTYEKSRLTEGVGFDPTLKLPGE
jgi:hypothetical protein